ncbi:unnamed protein product, partial [Laminaria digitata]
AETGGGWSGGSDSDCSPTPRSPAERGVGVRETPASDGNDDDDDEALDGYTASRGATFAGSDDDGWLEDSEEDGSSRSQAIRGGSGGGSGGIGSGNNGSGRDKGGGNDKGGEYGGGSAGSSSEDSSCEFDVSAANPIAVGDLWG